MKTTIGIFAHVDAGKTTLSEQILYKTGTIFNLGSVDNKNTIFDHDDIEKKRGITIFSDEAHFEMENDKYNIIDTPGHVDFSGEMERIIPAIDCAILVISGVDGIQNHTETVWRILKERNIPVIIFINKCDRESADINKVINDIKDLWKCNTVLYKDDFKRDIIEYSDELIEEIIMNDENLMENYLEGTIDNKTIEYTCGRLIRDRKVIPVVCGAAITGQGIETLLSLLKRYFGESYELLIKENSDFNNNGESDIEFSGVVYKVRHDKNGVRLTFIKVLDGEIRPKDEIITSYVGDEKIVQKINEIKIFNGQKSKQISVGKQGDLCAVTGLNDVIPGDFIGKNAHKGEPFKITPLMKVKVTAEDTNITNDKILSILKEFEEEEMMLHVSYEKSLGEIHIETMGDIQLETISSIIYDRYGVNLVFGNSEVIYKETISKAVVGCGHFEPLRHYAEVHIKLEPSKRGSGITFESNCSYDVLQQNYQSLIKTHIFEKEHKGVLIGAPICDIKMTLLSGRAHLKHTHGGDFREAVYRAIREGLMKTTSVLLEPWYSFDIRVEDSMVGKVLTDITTMGGLYDMPNHDGNGTIVSGKCPVRTMQPYIKEFFIFTKGKGKLNTTFDGYRECSDSEKIIESKGYNPENDVENTPDSVFCSHGSGYQVKWYDAEKSMHIPIESY